MSIFVSRRTFIFQGFKKEETKESEIHSFIRVIDFYHLSIFTLILSIIFNLFSNL